QACPAHRAVSPGSGRPPARLSGTDASSPAGGPRQACAENGCGVRILGRKPGVETDCAALHLCRRLGASVFFYCHDRLYAGRRLGRMAGAHGDPRQELMGRMSSKLLYIFAALCLCGVAAFIYFPLEPDHPFAYDEADYMWAGKQGLWANYTDRNALSFFEFVRKGIELS